MAITVEKTGAVGFNRTIETVTVELRSAEAGASRGWLRIDVHVQELEFKPLQVRDVWDEFHEISELDAC
jgi:sporulation-control protein spo0M